ncbi:MAG: hypothetical protein WC179_09460 [Candidatus Cloacimonadaceae bacterium]
MEEITEVINPNIVDLHTPIELANGTATKAEYISTTNYNMVICNLLTEELVVISRNTAYELGSQPFDIPATIDVVG